MRLARLSTRLLKQLVLTSLGFVLVGLLALWPSLNAPIMAQSAQIEQVAQQAYQKLPGLPLENEYVNDDTGRVSTNNTLISRLIRYHIYAKSRPPNYRLDWKLTLADYLGVNERMEPNTYPSGSSLRKNPIEGDKAAIAQLTLAQRMALVDLLAASFTPQTSAQPSPQPQATPAPSPAPTPTPAPASRFPRQPQPGDAQLLQP